MAKIGRNDPCPAAAARNTSAAAWPRTPRLNPGARRRAGAASPRSARLLRRLLRRLDAAANAVVDLIHAGNLDEAEQAAHDCCNASPTCMTATTALAWSTRSVATRQAVDYYRKVIGFVREHPDLYDPDSRMATKSSSTTSTPCPTHPPNACRKEDTGQLGGSAPEPPGYLRPNDAGGRLLRGTGGDADDRAR